MNKTQLFVALTMLAGHSVSFGAQVDPKNTLALMTSAERKAELQERAKNRESDHWVNSGWGSSNIGFALPINSIKNIIFKRN